MNRVEGGVVEDATTRLYINQSASILGSLGAGGAGAYVYATGPGTNYGNFDQADANGDFRVYGLENGKAYNIAASTQVKTGQNQFMTVAVSSVNVTATNAGADIGALTLPTPGYLRVAVAIPVAAPRELWGFIRAQSSDLTMSGIGTVHYATRTATSDSGANDFGGASSTWTVIGLPSGTYDLDVDVSGLGLSTRVTGIVVNPGARTDQAMSLQKRTNVYGLAVLPSTSTFGTWVSVQAIKFGEKYPSLSGGAFIPGVSVGVNPTSSTFVLYGLDPGSWTVQAMAPGFVAGSSQVLVSGSADIGDHLPGSCDLKLTSTGVITGTVTVTGNS